VILSWDFLQFCRGRSKRGRKSNLWRDARTLWPFHTGTWGIQKKRGEKEGACLRLRSLWPFIGGLCGGMPIAKRWERKKKREREGVGSEDGWGPGLPITITR